MTIRSSELAPLIDELHEADQQLAQAAQPLQSLSELEPDERQQIADHIRSGLARWEGITKKINEALRRSNRRD